jgi:hypothetical protein
LGRSSRRSNRSSRRTGQSSRRMNQSSGRTGQSYGRAKRPCGKAGALRGQKNAGVIAFAARRGALSPRPPPPLAAALGGKLRGPIYDSSTRMAARSLFSLSSKV